MDAAPGYVRPAVAGGPRSGVGGEARSSAMRGEMPCTVDCGVPVRHMDHAVLSGVHGVVAIAVPITAGRPAAVRGSVGVAVRRDGIPVGIAVRGAVRPASIRQIVWFMVMIPSAAVAVARIAVTFAVVGIGVTSAHRGSAVAISAAAVAVAIAMAISAEVAIAVSVVRQSVNAARNEVRARAAPANRSVERMRSMRRGNANRARSMSRRVSMNPGFGLRGRGASQPWPEQSEGANCN